MDPDAFHAHWRDVHAQHMADTPKVRRHIARYELNHRLPADYARDRQAGEVADAGYDGVAVLWFESMGKLQAMMAEPGLAEWAAADEPLFRDAAMPTVITHDPDVIVDTPRRGDAEVKLLCILRRHPALDLDTFHAHWRNNHGGLFQKIPALNEPLLAYDQNHGVALPDAPFDGVTEQWFASLEEWVASLGAEEHRRDVEPDVAYLLDPASIHFVMAGRPTVVIGA
jgi:uncharacterized protein (TIGR02118 family)